MELVGGEVHRDRRAAVCRLVVVILALAAFAACSSTAAAPRPGDPDTSVAETGSTLVVAQLAASSASGADQLAQVLMAPRPLPFPTLPPGAEPTTTVPAVPYKTGPRAESPVIIPPPPLPPGDGTVYAVGDSVLLGTKDYLQTTLGGWDLRFDARVGRAFPEGIDLVHENRANIGQAAIIVLGHNYWGGGKIYGYLDQMMADMRDVQRVIFVTVAEWSPAQVEVNRAIRALPKTYPNVVVADWAAVLAADPQFLIPDHVHLTAAGDVALANLLAIMLGPARPNGKIVKPPKILPLPGDPVPVSTTTSTTSTSTTSTTAPSTTTSSTPSSSTTSSTSTPSSSTTTTSTTSPP
jgi:lysophospholipase L1-like esterase